MKDKLETLQAEYAEIAIQEKEIAAKKARVKQNIEELLPQESTTLDTTYGKFTMVGRKNWTYSPAVKRIEEDLKILKVEEEESEVATYEEVFGLRFNPKK